MGTYVFDNAMQVARERLQLLETAADPGTFRVLETIGVDRGWRCLEIGAGAGSVAAWLSTRVGPTGTVLATDVDPRFLDPIAADHPNLVVRRHDVVADDLPEAAFDLIHARMVLEHLPERERALCRLAAALAPGGWLVVEAVDFVVETLDPALDGVYGELFARARETRLLGGSVGTEIYRLSLIHLRDRFLAGGYLDHADIDDIQAMYEDRRFAATSPLIMAVWGRRPEYPYRPLELADSHWI
jgi:SAM-dependent methyltransferase